MPPAPYGKAGLLMDVGDVESHTWSAHTYGGAVTAFAVPLPWFVIVQV